MKSQLFLIIFLLSITLVSAVDVTYTVKVSAHDENNTAIDDSKIETNDCELLCTYAMPSFSLPEGSIIDSFSVSSDASVYFESTNSKTTTNEGDNIVVKVAPTCTQSKCEASCVKCTDKVCHEPGFKCFEEITIEKFFPTEINLGTTELKFVLKNTGTINLDDVYIIVTGDGLETAGWTPLQNLNVGDRDYVFSTVNATKSGTIDIVLKLYVAGNLRNKLVDQITILEQTKIEPVANEINATQLTDSLNELKQQYKSLEQTYLDKKEQGYQVDLIYDRLREVYNYITETQSSTFEGDYKKAQANLGIVLSALNDIKDELDDAKKQEQTFGDKFKNLLFGIGSFAAVIVSIFTAYKLMQNSVNKKKIIALHRKLTKRRFAKKKELQK